ncbi:C-GCAxxG-C-C family protein [Lachnospiraceae bacterium OttesenSCG-928-J05]|nr:C-GCAxxG-C-C family protein [Lachnospiraceae bacterium OttesenSCG-928-J05]
MELSERIMELIQNGYHCSQVMMQLSLDLREREEPFTIRALGALGGGMFAQRTCGTLTGGVAMLSSYFERAEDESEPTGYRECGAELVEWFALQWGSLDCRDIVTFEIEEILKVCPEIMEQTFLKCIEILEAHGIDPTQ